ncbi:MAG TPA: type II secretion system F family protein [Abditibacterium sp.]|jgi:hypothetical protein
MTTARELITICRQIGTMMEVGVDFLRILRALREQTDNPRLLELYDQIEHDMRMGGNLADAIDKAPDVFSPFAVSLIRQGDVRGDIEGAWHRLADFYKQEAQENKDLGLDASGSATGGAPRAGIGGGETVRGLEQLEWLFISFVGWIGALLLAITLVWCAAAAGFIAPRWMVPLQLGLAALLAMTAAGQWSAARDKRERSRVAEAPAPILGQNRAPVAVAPPPLSHLPADAESVRAAMDDQDGDDFEAPRFGRDEERPF